MTTDKLNGWAPRPDLARALVDKYHTVYGPCPKLECYIKGDCRVILAEEPWGGSPVDHTRHRTHLSISCQFRLPTWDEVKDARYSLMGLGLQVAMMLPPSNEYINVHNYCFHLYEIPDPRIG